MLALNLWLLKVTDKNRIRPCSDLAFTCDLDSWQLYVQLCMHQDALRAHWKRTYRPHSEVVWAAYGNIRLAVSMQMWPHWRNIYSIEVHSVAYLRIFFFTDLCHHRLLQHSCYRYSPLQQNQNIFQSRHFGKLVVMCKWSLIRHYLCLLTPIDGALY